MSSFATASATAQSAARRCSVFALGFLVGIFSTCLIGYAFENICAWTIKRESDRVEEIYSAYYTALGSNERRIDAWLEYQLRPEE